MEKKLINELLGFTVVEVQSHSINYPKLVCVFRILSNTNVHNFIIIYHMHKRENSFI